MILVGFVALTGHQPGDRADGLRGPGVRLRCGWLRAAERLRGCGSGDRLDRLRPPGAGRATAADLSRAGARARCSCWRRRCRYELLFAPVLVAVGATSLYYLTGGNTLIQMTVAPQLRGRVMAIYIMVFFGAQAVSGMIIGFVADHVGAQVAMMVTAAGPLAGGRRRRPLARAATRAAAAADPARPPRPRVRLRAAARGRPRRLERGTHRHCWPPWAVPVRDGGRRQDCC